MFKTSLYILLTITVFSSCARELSPLAYVQYVEQIGNGLKHEIVTGNLKLTLQYKPSDYILIQELKQEKITQKEYQTALDNQGKGFIYFNLKMSSINLKNQISDLSNNEETKLFLTNEFRESIKLTINKIEYPCSIYYLETGMGVFPHSTALIGFEVDRKNKENISLNLFQNQILNQPITFSIQEESINNIPALKLL